MALVEQQIRSRPRESRANAALTGYGTFPNRCAATLDALAVQLFIALAVPSTGTFTVSEINRSGVDLAARTKRRADHRPTGFNLSRLTMNEDSAAQNRFSCRSRVA
jgi:hypothetical protein